MFRVIDANENPNLIVSKDARKDRAISAAANRYRGQAVTLTVQKQNKAGKFETVAIFTTK